MLLLQNVHLIGHNVNGLVLLGGKFHKEQVQHCVYFIVESCLIKKFI